MTLLETINSTGTDNQSYNSSDKNTSSEAQLAGNCLSTPTFWGYFDQ